MQLTKELLEQASNKIEQVILNKMDYLFIKNNFEDYCTKIMPKTKFIEHHVQYFDYRPTGISVLANFFNKQDSLAIKVVNAIFENMKYYRKNVFNKTIDGINWKVPLRRLLFHIALFYQKTKNNLDEETLTWLKEFTIQEVEIAIEHCQNFYPGVKDIHLTKCNNHTAIFMQGVYYCGIAFDEPDWIDITKDFARRYFESGHQDGYFEENTNDLREGGPSLLYTPLTAGCLFDVLDGKKNKQNKFLKAGEFYRSLLNNDRMAISIADERSNTTGCAHYGLALHSLSSEGRAFIYEFLENYNYDASCTEQLAVLHHEISLMTTGETTKPEYSIDGSFKLTLPLGVIRKNGFTASLSALRSLNKIVQPNSDYALDHQNHTYLSHKDKGVIFTGYKSNKNPDFSTFRIGDDAYTQKTGELEIGDNNLSITVYYESFIGKINLTITDYVEYDFHVDVDKEVTTVMPFNQIPKINSSVNFEIIELPGFSPYNKNNKTDTVKALKFKWKNSLKFNVSV